MLLGVEFPLWVVLLSFGIDRYCCSFWFLPDDRLERVLIV